MDVNYGGGGVMGYLHTVREVRKVVGGGRRGGGSFELFYMCPPDI